MKPAELGEEIAVDLEALEATVNELLALRRETVREKTAAAAFLAQSYNGIENILKRISRCHIELFFCATGHCPKGEAGSWK